MKLIFLIIALVAFASAQERRDQKPPPLKGSSTLPPLLNPAYPDEKTVTFDCTSPGREKPYCGTRMDDAKFFEIKWAHRPTQTKEKGFNCERMNAPNHFCCNPRWNPTPNKGGKRLSKRETTKKPSPDTPNESTIFTKIPEEDINQNCIRR